MDLSNLELLFDRQPDDMSGGSWRWGVVEAPGQVKLGAEDNPIYVSDSLVPYVKGARVLVHIAGTRAVIIGQSGGPQMPGK